MPCYPNMTCYGIGIGIGIFNDNVVNNYTRLRCEEEARMHLNGMFGASPRLLQTKKR
jgi:hypothetical protein